MIKSFYLDQRVIRESDIHTFTDIMKDSKCSTSSILFEKIVKGNITKLRCGPQPIFAWSSKEVENLSKLP